MRITLDIEDDLLDAVREMARRDGRSAGRVLSELARRGLAARRSSEPPGRRGVPLLPKRGDVVTLEHVQRLMDAEGVCAVVRALPDVNVSIARFDPDHALADASIG